MLSARAHANFIAPRDINKASKRSRLCPAVSMRLSPQATRGQYLCVIDRSYSLTVLAQIEEKGSLFTEALGHAEDSLAIDERLARLDSSNVMWQRDVRVSRRLVARLRSSMNDRSGKAD